MGRQILIFAGGVVFALALAVLVRAVQAQEPPRQTAIPVDCGSAVCVIPKAVFQAVIESHNAMVDEVRKLKAELAGRGRACPGDKGA